jgi:XRE family aerobic/anaerobic benzoate catabolism transcriptional regulator
MNTAPKSVGADPQGPIALNESDPGFLASLGRRVREAREQRGMARKVLSRTADVSERYLAQLEAGEGNASVVLLRRVAVALGVRLTDLLDSAEPVAEHRLIRRFLDSLPRERLTLGAELAKTLRRRFVELDKEIEREAGISLPEVFLLYGQEGYRRIERRCLERMINSQEDMVLTVGGGIVSEPETYQLLLLNCYTVWVKAAPEEHMARVVAQGDLRPMAGHAEAMEDLRNILSARESLYGKADVVVDTSGRTVEESFATLQRRVDAD